MGTDAADDVLVFEEKDETFSTFVYKSKSKEYMIIGCSSTLTSEYRVLSADDPGGEFRVLQPRERGLEYYMAHFGDYFYIITNLDAINFRLDEDPCFNGEKENWEEVIAHREDVLLEGIEIFSDYLVVNERKEGLNQLRVIRWEDGLEHYVEMGEEVYTAWISTNVDFDSKLLRYAYSSLTTPVSTFDYHLDSREKILLKQQEVVGDFDPTNYEAKRLYAIADDGKKIPMSIVYRKGIELDGSNPTLLYGYGSYGLTMDPVLQLTPLIAAGPGICICHWRTSGAARSTEGPGMRMENCLKKMNTFTDFNDCAEHLIREKYTSPEHLFAMGGSAGGLLMGAIINLQPELYHGVIAAVPFVDVVTTMLDDEIPLTTGEYDEWGNPNEEEYYRYMLSYSPYDQVEKKDYPKPACDHRTARQPGAVLGTGQMGGQAA